MVTRTPDEQLAFDDKRRAADDAVQAVAEQLAQKLHGKAWTDLGFDHSLLRNLAADAVATARRHDAGV
jgi:hypothetical protein